MALRSVQLDVSGHDAAKCSGRQSRRNRRLHTANAKSWEGMKDWLGIPLVFDAEDTYQELRRLAAEIQRRKAERQAREAEEKRQREAEREEQRRQLQAIQEELRKAREEGHPMKLSTDEKLRKFKSASGDVGAAQVR